MLSDLQIGSSSITDADWSVPQIVTMDLVGGNNGQEQKQPYSNNTSEADLYWSQLFLTPDWIRNNMTKRIDVSF